MESLLWHESTHFPRTGPAVCSPFPVMKARKAYETDQPHPSRSITAVDRTDRIAHDSFMSPTTFIMEVNGYVCEIMCGYIPSSLKQAFIDHLLSEEAGDDRPEWVLKRTPNYVNPDRVRSMWYENDDLMGRLALRAGCTWRSYRDIRDVFHGIGFGTGKDTIGLFDIQVRADEKLLMEFVPFDPVDRMGHPLVRLEDVAVIRNPAPPPPAPRQGLVAVSGGSWAKGTLRFSGDLGGGFDPDALALMVMDLTSLGVGEDHFVSEIRYRGQPLGGEIIREIDREMYPVSWYSHEKARWRPMYHHH